MAWRLAFAENSDASCKVRRFRRVSVIRRRERKADVERSRVELRFRLQTA